MPNLLGPCIIRRPKVFFVDHDVGSRTMALH